MQITPYPDIDRLLASLVDEIQRILDAQLVGVYLYGSLVTGDFDREISDVDLLAVTTSDLDDQAFDQLDQMHLAFVERHLEWNDRIEIAYLSTSALKTFRTQRSTIAIISPGEPFHRKEAGKDWLINWWTVREKGVALFGPAPRAVIDPIAKHEFLQAVRDQAREWGEYVVHTMNSRPYQGYAILTMCRALYAYTNGEQASKRQAAEWAAQRLPQWGALIRDALAWRAAYRDHNVDPSATFPETKRFVQFVIDQMSRA